MANNNQDNGAAMGIAIVAVVAIFAFAFIYAGLVLLALFYSVVAFRALKAPVTVFGETMTPQMARDYFKRGAIGAVVVPIFIIFAFSLLDARLNPDYFWMLPVGGYAFGSFVVGAFIEKAKLQAAEQEAAMRALLPPEPPARPARTIEAAPSLAPKRDDLEDAEPFRFATWDDEEELRK